MQGYIAGAVVPLHISNLDLLRYEEYLVVSAAFHDLFYNRYQQRTYLADIVILKG